MVERLHRRPVRARLRRRVVEGPRGTGELREVTPLNENGSPYTAIAIVTGIIAGFLLGFALARFT